MGIGIWHRGLCESPFMYLPLEVVIHILTYLPVTDLQSARNTCTAWAYLCLKTQLWRELALRDQEEWPAIQSDPVCKEPHDRDWKDYYLRHHNITLSTLAPESRHTQFSNKPFLSTWFSKQPDKIYPVAIFGSSRPFFFTLMANKPNLPITKLYGGRKGIGSGFGIRVSNKNRRIVELNLSVIAFPKSGSFELWAALEPFLHTTIGFIYVISRCESQDYFEKMLSTAETDLPDVLNHLISSHETPCPFLLLVLRDSQSYSYPIVNIVERLQLGKLCSFHSGSSYSSIPWRAQAVDLQAPSDCGPLTGMLGGLEWLAGAGISNLK